MQGYVNRIRRKINRTSNGHTGFDALNQGLLQLLLVLGEGLDGDNKGVEEDEEAKEDKAHIATLAPHGLVGESLQMEQGREDKQQWSTGKGSNKTNKDIQLVVTCIGNSRNRKINQHTDHILLQRCHLATIRSVNNRSDNMLHNADAREQHQRGGQVDRDDVQQLDSVLAGLLSASCVREVIEDNRLDVVTISCIAQTTKADEEDTDNGEHNGQCARELLGVSHASTNRNNHSNSLIREHGYNHLIREGRMC